MKPTAEQIERALERVVEDYLERADANLIDLIVKHQPVHELARVIAAHLRGEQEIEGWAEEMLYVCLENTPEHIDAIERLLRDEYDPEIDGESDRDGLARENGRYAQ